MSLDRRTFLVGALAAGVSTTVLGAPPAGARTLGTQDWMAGLPAGTALQRMTIPGTHDSGALHGGLYVACQNIGIGQQLDAGIRFLDVRCRVTGGSFAIHHGSFYQHLMFGDVLVSCRNFLAAHPSETLLMRVKQEYSGDSDATFRAIFDDYLDARGWRSLFHIAPTLPALGQARGKVVLLADNGGLPGIRYGDGAHFDIQDDYNTEPFAKRGRIENHFRKAVSQPGKLYVNYVSTSAYMPPRWNADRLNPQIHSFVTGGEMAGRTGLGVVPMDFPNTRGGFIDSLIARNPF